MCYSQSVKEATKLPLVRNKKRILLNPYINNHLMFAAPRFEIIKGLLITKGARSRTPGSQENVVYIPLKSKAPVKNMPHSSILSRERQWVHPHFPQQGSQQLKIYARNTRNYLGELFRENSKRVLDSLVKSAVLIYWSNICKIRPPHSYGPLKPAGCLQVRITTTPYASRVG